MSDKDEQIQLAQAKHALLQLKKRAQFVNMTANGVKVPTSGLVLQFLERADDDLGRVGYTVTKKVGNAVVRNRVKRRLRSVVRELALQFSFCGIDMVLIGRKSTIDRPYPDIVKDFQRALRKADFKFKK